ncbi:MAG: TolC family protein [Gemmatimonadota bacterium]|nr:TolC family protein [Gemmatimonadota bacterium]
MKLALTLVVAAVSLPATAVGQDSLPRVTLEEALERAARLDPNYVAASRQIADAAWARRAAITAFIIPAISSQLSITTYSNQTFNIGTGEPASTIAIAQISGRLNLFAGLSKVHELARTAAELEGARASELESRFATALLTESDYYDVVAQRELTRVAQERVRRAIEQLAVARARVLAGGAVQTDSLQLLLELTEARVGLLRQEAQLKVARYALARRIGAPGPVDAEFRDTLAGVPLPLTQEQALAEAVEASPQAIAARASERAAEALVRSTAGSYLPSVDLFGQVSAFDEKLFPNAISRSSIGVSVSLPIWDNGQRELTQSRAKTARDIARALRNDLELVLRRDVVQAYEAYESARAASLLAEQAVIVARENLRVQAERYRAGATTIIDLITAQVSLSEAEAGLVQATYGTRLALSGLEAILGRRLF